MSVRGFQRALCDLIADPELCLRLRREPARVLDRYPLDERERRRLREVAWQPGMSVNCTLYRANRITPLHTLLPHTCTLLGDRLREEASAFWRDRPARGFFRHEAQGFGEFLRERVAAGKLEDPYLIETLDFELAFNELRLAPRRRLIAELRERPESGRWGLSPLVRVVRFEHDPASLLEALAEGRVPQGLPRSPCYVSVDRFEDEPSVRALDSARLGTLLAGVEPGTPIRTDGLPDVRALAESRLLVPL